MIVGGISRIQEIFMGNETNNFVCLNRFFVLSGGEEFLNSLVPSYEYNYSKAVSLSVYFEFLFMNSTNHNDIQKVINLFVWPQLYDQRSNLINLDSLQRRRDNLSIFFIFDLITNCISHKL